MNKLASPWFSQSGWPSSDLRTRRMGSARKLATLRERIERIETQGVAIAGRIALGHGEADAALQGGLARGALHEVFAEGGRHGAVATGFIAGLTARVSARRPLVWVRQDFCEIEAGSLSMQGLAELGLDPRALVTV